MSARSQWWWEWGTANREPVHWTQAVETAARVYEACIRALEEAERLRVGESEPRKAQAVSAISEAERSTLLLGVRIDASADEIRAALRSKLGKSRVHPDHGGDGEEAKRLIAAKNLLIERLKVQS